jgi:transcriptional regulator GlxA family with amidase domain
MGPNARLGDAVGSEVVIVPGAVDIDTVATDPAVRSAVTRLAAPAVVASSVCTGAFLLGDAGLVADRPFTTHWEDVDALALRLDATSGQARRARWVDAGSIVTAGGLSSGIAMALHLVDRLADRSLAERTARQLDYEWSPDVADATTPPASI